MTGKLTKAQESARDRLTSNWASSYVLQVRRSTLDALVKLGIAERVSGVGSIFSPNTSIKYRLRARNPKP